MDFNLKDFDPLKLVEGVAELLASEAHKKGLSLLTYVHPNIPAILHGDPGRLRQIILNLAGNAVKFTRKGEVVIRAEVEEDRIERVFVRFSVTDSGIGIGKTSGNIFQPFTQEDGSSTRAYGGTGLGLSIAKRLIELMGGTIDFTSKKGKGSVFWFIVPLERASVKVIETVSPSLLIELANRRVMVVDDSRTSQTILLNHLLAWDMKGVAVENCDEALVTLQHEALAGNIFNLVIVNINRPSPDYINLAKECTRNPLLAATQFLMLTPISDPEHVNLFLQAGYAGFLLKPMRQEKLLESIISLIAQEKRSQEARDNEPSASPSVRGSEGEGKMATDIADKKMPGQETILLAEDNAVNQKLACMQLNRLGFIVDTAANGREAVEKYCSRDYLFILMDCQMPIMNGFEATRAIRQWEEEQKNGRHIPIIAMTANAEQSDRQHCLDAGMDDYLGKPVRQQDLNEKIDFWLKNKKMSDVPPLPITHKMLEEQFGHNRGMIRELLSLFIAAADESIAAIQEAIRQRDTKTLLLQTQQLRDAASGIGANSLISKTERMTLAASSAQWEEEMVLFEEINKDFVAIRNMANHYS